MTGDRAGDRWRARTPQEFGHSVEQETLRTFGARQHPGSGSGTIPFDGSDKDHIYEIKSAKTSFRLTQSYVQRLFTAAVRRGKTAVLVLRFPRFEVVMNIRRRSR